MSIIVIHGPPGTGKTTNAMAFAKAFGVGTIVDDGVNSHQPFPHTKAIVLTTRSPEEVKRWRRDTIKGDPTAEAVAFVPILAALDRIGRIGEIADGLSPAMKALVVRGKIGQSDCANTVRSLISRRLAKVEPKHFSSVRSCIFTLTPLGEAVQRRLQEAAK